MSELRWSAADRELRRGDFVRTFSTPHARLLTALLAQRPTPLGAGALGALAQMSTRECELALRDLHFALYDFDCFIVRRGPRGARTFRLAIDDKDFNFAGSASLPREGAASPGSQSPSSSSRLDDATPLCSFNDLRRIGQSLAGSPPDGASRSRMAQGPRANENSLGAGHG
jgi:hypothetical protein